jgi:hypothetical protein
MMAMTILDDILRVWHTLPKAADDDVTEIQLRDHDQVAVLMEHIERGKELLWAGLSPMFTGIPVVYDDEVPLGHARCVLRDGRHRDYRLA